MTNNEPLDRLPQYITSRQLIDNGYLLDADFDGISDKIEQKKREKRINILLENCL